LKFFNDKLLTVCRRKRFTNEKRQLKHFSNELLQVVTVIRILYGFYRACLYIFLEPLREEDFKFIFLLFLT